jgi:Tol biopolymer transport system component
MEYLKTVRISHQLSIGENDMTARLFTGLFILAISNLGGLVQAASSSPDGTKLAYSFIGNPENIYVSDSDGENIKEIVVRSQRDFRPEWSNDGTHLVFTSVIENVHVMMRVDADGQNLQQISLLKDAAGDPDYSPDGKRLIFFSDEPRPRELFLRDLETGKDKRLTNTNDFDEMSPRWAPDGRQVVFVGRTKGDGVESDIWTFDTESGYRQNLTNTPIVGEFHPDWSHDGTMVVYIRVSSGNFDVAVRSLESGQEKIVASGEGYAVLDPHFTRDDRNVIFTRTDFAEKAPGTPSIVSVNLDSLEETKLVQGKFP